MTVPIPKNHPRIYFSPKEHLWVGDGFGHGVRVYERERIGLLSDKTRGAKTDSGVFKRRLSGRGRKATAPDRSGKQDGSAS